MKIACRGIEYNVETIGQGEPLVFLHGFTGASSNWSHIISSFFHNRKIILVDLIGHGKTDKPDDYIRYSMDEAANDLREILLSLGVQKSAVLGYSMGGRLALSFTVKYPEMVSTLILESASPGLKTENERTERRQSDRKLAHFIQEKGLKEFVDYWSDIPLFQSQKMLPQEVQDSIKFQRNQNSSTGLINSLLGMGTGSQPSWWDLLEGVKVPVLLVTGEKDQKFCKIAEEMNQLLPNSEWKIINQAGHAIHVEQPEKFGKIVSDYLSKFDRRD